MGRHSKRENRGPNHPGYKAARQKEQPRQNDGRFASTGASGKEKVPTSYSGPARPALDSKVALTQTSAAPTKVISTRIPNNATSTRGVTSSVDDEGVMVPVLSDELRKAYKAYESVRDNGIRPELKDFALELEDLLEDITFKPKEKDEEWSVSWCSDGEIASGNSTAIAQALHDALSYNIEEGSDEMDDEDNWFDSIRGWRVNLLTIAFEGPIRRETYSANLLIAPDGDEWVLDYSAKAFDGRAPFPLIQPRILWQEWVKKQNDDKILLSTKVSR